MKKNDQPTDATGDKARVEKAEAQIEQAKAQTEQAKAREEQAKAREEQAKAREEQAKTRAVKAETRTEQVETVLQNVLLKDAAPLRETSARLLSHDGDENADQKNLLEQLTGRQREILQLIAEGQNTKQIAEVLKVSPKTVEYHRMKLMAGLNLHDIPGLVRFALRVGLIKPET
jgi:DNA-binding CsgD family transcriptional regulator